MRQWSILSIYVLLIFISCQAQQNHNTSSALQTSNAEVRSLTSQSCENCDLMFVNMPTHISAADTTDGWFEQGQKLIVTGNIFHADGLSPAADVIVYYYHTDQKGYYDPGNKTDAGAGKHGRLRGWVKSGSDGRYAIYTNRPAQYPENTFEAHIHVIVQEPDMDTPYWIDEWVFADDPLLTTAHKSRMEKRGGSGILEIKEEADVQVTHHNIILGLNIPGYPASK